jgi:FG-GAP-like repeat
MRRCLYLRMGRGGKTKFPPLRFTIAAVSSPGVALAFTLTALTPTGQVNTSYTGTVAFTSGDTAATLPANTTLAAGVGVFSATLVSQVTQTITATDQTTSSITGHSAGIVVALNLPTHFSVNIAGNVTNATAIKFTVTAMNQFNTTATDYTGTVQFTSGDIYGYLPLPSTITAGVGVFSATLNTYGTRSLTVTDVATSSITGASSAIAVYAPSYFVTSLWDSSIVGDYGSANMFIQTSYDGKTFVNKSINYAIPSLGISFRDHDLVNIPSALLPGTSRWYLSSDADNFGTPTYGYGWFHTTDDGYNWNPCGSGKLDMTGYGFAIFINPRPRLAPDGTVWLFFIGITNAQYALTGISVINLYASKCTNYSSIADLSTASWGTPIQLQGPFTNGGDTDVYYLPYQGQSYIFHEQGTGNINLAVASSETAVYSAIQSGNWSGVFDSSFSTCSPTEVPDGLNHRLYFDDVPGISFTSQSAGAGDMFSGQAPAGAFTFSTMTNCTIPGLGASRSPSVNLVVGVNAATKFVLASLVTAAAGVGFAITVTAETFGNFIAVGYTGTVHFTGSATGMTLPADATLVSGVGIFSATLTHSGGSTFLTATDTQTNTVKGSIGFSVSVGPVNHFLVSWPSTATAAVASVGTVTAQDAYNNTVTAYSGTVGITCSDGGATLPPNNTLGSGTRKFTATLNTAGNQTITATDIAAATLTGHSGTITLGGSAPATHFVLADIGSVNAGSVLVFTVTAETSSNVTATSYTGTVTFSSNDANTSVKLPANATLVNGVGVFSATLVTATSTATVTATDTVASSITGSTTSITVNPAAMNHIGVTAPGAVTSGLQFSMTCTAYDAYGNVATGSTDSVTFTTSDGAGSVNSGETQFSSGLVTVSATLLTAGNQTITGTTQTAGYTATSSNISVSVVATKFIVLNPANAVVNSPFGFAVLATNASGIVAATYTGTVDLTCSDSKATLPANTTITSGVGTFSATLLTHGNVTITATDATSGSINGAGQAINLGISDLAVAGTTDAEVLLGNGNGTFQAKTVYTVDGEVIGPFAVGDINGDGKLDLAFSPYMNPGRVDVLLGNGNGTFQAEHTYATGANGPYATVLADVNGDGKLDLVVGNFGGSTISVLLGNGDGTFQAANQFTAHKPRSLAVADINGDGKLDIVAPASDNNNCSVLLGNGNGTFQAATAQGSSTYPQDAILVDVNGDGILDLVTASYTDSSISVFLGNGNGTFGAGTRFATGDRPTFAVAGDVNADGKVDLVVNGFVQSNVSVLLGNGNGTFQLHTDFTANTSPRQVVLCDFNGDGKLDIVVADSGFTAVSVLLGNGNGTFQAKTDFTTGNGPYAVAAGAFRSVYGVQNFAVSNGSTATVGTATAVTVVAKNVSGSIDGAYNGTVRFICTDAAATVPANTTLTNGSGIFSVTLNTAGSQTVRAVDTITGAWGKGATITAS